MYCNSCGTQIPDGSKFCPACGKPLVDENAVVFCTSCGTRLTAGADVCPSCGAPVPAVAPKAAPAAAPAPQPTVIINNSNNNINSVSVPSGKRCDKWIAFLLCLFLGCIGAHRFYEGKVGTGILYLLTLGLCGFGALVDLIIILGKPNPYYV